MTAALFTTAPRFRKALYETARYLFEPDGIAVLLGPPEGTVIPDEVVEIRGVKTEQATGPMSPNRPRDESLRVEVLVSVATGGGPEVDEALTDRAYELLGRLEFYCRVTDTTLGGTVRQCFLTGHESEGALRNETAGGRYIDVVATFTAHARVTGTA